MFCLQVDFTFLERRVNTIDEAIIWAEIGLRAGANMVTIWFQEKPDKQASTIVKTLWS